MAVMSQPAGWRTVDIVVAAVIAVAFGVVFWAWNLVWAAWAPLFGGPANVNLGGIATPPGYVGRAFINFGVGFGPKAYTPPALWVGELHLLNYP